MHDTLASRGRVQYDPYTPEQQFEIQQIATAYLVGKKEEIEEISSMRQVKELLNQMRNSFLKLKQDGKNVLEAEQIGVPGTAESDAGNIQRRATLRDEGVGIEVDQGEFGLGKAPLNSRPVNKIELSKEKEAEIQQAQQFEDY